LYVLLLRAASGVITVLVVVGFALSDRVDSLLPHTTLFLVVFACAVVALLAWAEAISGQWPQERAVYASALRRLAHWFQSRRRRDR
jgi:hypothetical protein